MEKQGLELLREKLEQAGRDLPTADTEAPPLPPELQELARQMAQRQGLDPLSGEVEVSSVKH